MSDVNAFLLESASTMARELYPFKEVVCAAVIGSVAVGEADELSDLEVVCLCTELHDRLKFTIQDRLGERFNVVGARALTSPIPRVGIYFRHGGFKMSLKLSRLEEYQDFMLRNHREFLDEDWLRNLARSRILFDKDGKISELKLLVARYPKDRAREIVKQGLGSLGYAIDLLRKAAARRDRLAFFMALREGIASAVRVLYAVNGVYLSRSFKRAILDIRGFKLKPVACEDRLRFLVEEGNTSELMMRKIDVLEGLREGLLAYDPKR